ncbi:STAS domain-containing protein [Sphingomonas sp. MMS24-J45]|uniref:STAS domain-containing protein n=1 Tax=Sphingomonas sp. MMS24-J45 TaxID=3238806 RepID=UPI00384C69B6
MTLTPNPPDLLPELEEPAATVVVPLADVTDPGVIRLTGHGATVTAEALRAELVLAADTAASTSIDASELLSVGQAVLQLLIAAREDALQNDHPFEFIGASAAFSERVIGCQLAEVIGLSAGKEMSL